MIGFPLSLSMNFISKVAFSASATFSSSETLKALRAYLLCRFCGVCSILRANSASEISPHLTQHSFMYSLMFIIIEDIQKSEENQEKSEKNIKKSEKSYLQNIKNSVLYKHKEKQKILLRPDELREKIKKQQEAYFMSNEVVKTDGFDPVSLMPKTFNEKYQMAGVMAKSGLLPQGLNTPEKVCVALEWGHELQLSPMVAVQNIAVINGKPTLSADIMAAVVKRSPEYGGCEWKELSDKAAECVVTRKRNGYEEKTASRFTIEDAAKAGLTSRPVWRSYPKRMLKHRALAYALRDTFPDILAGIYSQEEMESVDAGEQTGIEKIVEQEAEQEQYYIFNEGVPRPEFNPDTKPADKPEQIENVDTQMISMKFADLLQKYQNQLGDNYAYAYEAFQTGSDSEMVAMYNRCVTYLGKKGIKVA